MTGITAEIMAEVLIIIAMATKEVKRGRMSELIFALPYDCLQVFGLEKYLKKLIGNTDIEDSLEQLDKLTQEEARMASAEQLRVAHSVDRKLDDTTRSSSLIAHAFILNARVSSQGTCSATTSYGGFRLRIHQSIITLRPRPITMVPLSGSFKAVFSTNGSPLVRFYGYMENVRFSQFPLCDVNPNHLDSVAGSGKSVLWLVLPPSSTCSTLPD